MKQTLKLHGRTHLPTGSDPIPGFGGTTYTVVYGALYNDATTLEEGSGDWTAEWNDEDMTSPDSNLYTIRFDTSFSAVSSVQLTGNNNNPPNDQGRYTVTLRERNVAYIVVRTDDVDDADAVAQDGGFEFLVVGTR